MPSRRYKRVDNLPLWYPIHFDFFNAPHILVAGLSPPLERLVAELKYADALVVLSVDYCPH